MTAVSMRVDGPVTIVTIERPEVKNAVDGPTARSLHEAFQRFAESEEQLVAVLTGAGGTFCAGADLRAVANEPERANPLEADGTLGPMGPTRLELDKPVIAAIEGHAVAGGLELAIWCDLRVAASDAVLGCLERRWGVPLIDGGTVRLPRLIGQGRALDLVLTGREVTAEEAARIGLVDRVVAPGTALQSAVALAHDLAGLPQAALRGDRRSLRDQWPLELGDALSNEFRLGLQALETGEAGSGAARFLDRPST